MPFDETDPQPSTPGSGLMPRATISQLVAAKLKAQHAYLDTWDALATARDLERFAAPSGNAGDLPYIAAGSVYGNYTKTFKNREEFEAHVGRALDQNVWAHVIQATKLDQLMDREERELFRKTLQDDPPEASVENIAATIERLVGESDMIFKRGIANAFAKLDRRFRSHDGFKIGSRVVLSYAFDSWGSWSRGQDDVLYDVEKTFQTLDGKPGGERYSGIIGLIDVERRKGSSLQRRAFEVSGDYFRVCVYKNGNAHLWFTRKDLVGRVNQLLADYYGANLGAGADVADVKHAYASTPATSGGGFGFFPSPEQVVARVLDKAGLSLKVGEGSRGYEQKRLHILEPSAGTGQIALAAARLGHDVTAIEIQQHLCRELSATDQMRRVVQDDFLRRSPADLGKFDVILMNPPFDGGRDVDHVTHALQFLVEGGILVSVMGAGVEFREDRKTSDFRKEVERRGGKFFDLPAASFAPATYINTTLCCIGRRNWW